MKKLLLASVVGFTMAASPSWAFWSQTNTTEAYGILPSHTAFWIPGTGDKDSQQQTETEDYLKDRKVPGKFFIIPHVKLVGSTYMTWDYYIPAGRLIIVDRTPYFHEWTMKGRGTETGSDTSFPCHSKDNIEVTAEMSMAASVEEADAAKFLYHFGVNAPVGNPAQPEVIFTSVFEGKNLAQIMSGWGRGEFQSRVCRKINEHDIGSLGENGNKILDEIQNDVKKFFLSYGITVEYIGWAGGFTFPPEVGAINSRWSAEHVQPVLPTLERKAVIDATSGWDRHLPNSLTIIGNPDNGGVLGQVVGGLKIAAEPQAPVSPTKK